MAIRYEYRYTRSRHAHNGGAAHHARCSIHAAIATPDGTHIHCSPFVVGDTAAATSGATCRTSSCSFPFSLNEICLKRSHLFNFLPQALHRGSGIPLCYAWYQYTARHSSWAIRRQQPVVQQDIMQFSIFFKRNMSKTKPSIPNFCRRRTTGGTAYPSVMLV